MNLRAVISQGDIGRISNREAHFRQLGQTVVAVGSEVADFVDAANEGYATGESDPAALSQCMTWFRAEAPGPLVTLTSPYGEEKADLDAYSIPPADVYDVHGYREGHFYDKIRHIFSNAYERGLEKRLGIQSEPAGPGAGVTGVGFPDELDGDTLLGMALMSLLARQAWVYMSEQGIWCTGNIYDMIGFEEVATAPNYLPSDIMSWPTLFRGGDTWAASRVYPAVGAIRCDHAMNGNDFACLMYGPDSPAGIEPVRAIASITRDVMFGSYIRLVVGTLA
jgi:hypothetical protein